MTSGNQLAMLKTVNSFSSHWYEKTHMCHQWEYEHTYIVLNLFLMWITKVTVF